MTIGPGRHGAHIGMRPIIHLNMKAEVRDHSPHLRRRLARRRQIAVDEDGICRIQRKRLEGSEIMFSPAGDAYFRLRVQEAEQAEHFQAALRGQLITVFQRCPARGMQRVNGNGIRLDLTQCEGQVDDVLVGFSHTHDPPEQISSPAARALRSVLSLS